LRTAKQVRTLVLVSIEEIRALKHAKPFRPFDIVTKTGRTFHVELPIRIALSPTGRSVSGFDPEGFFFLPLNEIASLRLRRVKKKAR
jgi:hypothetical protein